MNDLSIIKSEIFIMNFLKLFFRFWKLANFRVLLLDMRTEEDLNKQKRDRLSELTLRYNTWGKVRFLFSRTWFIKILQGI